MSKKLNPASRQEIERVKNWLNLEDPITIVTHQFVDADAAFSAALLRVLRPRASLIFTRADSEISDESMLAVDLSEGTQSVKGLNVGSSFGLILLAIKDIDNPVYNSLKLWAKQLNKAADSVSQRRFQDRSPNEGKGIGGQLLEGAISSLQMLTPIALKALTPLGLGF